MVNLRWNLTSKCESNRSDTGFQKTCNSKSTIAHIKGCIDNGNMGLGITHFWLPENDLDVILHPHLQCNKVGETDKTIYDAEIVITYVSMCQTRTQQADITSDCETSDDIIFGDITVPMLTFKPLTFAKISALCTELNFINANINNDCKEMYSLHVCASHVTQRQLKETETVCLEAYLLLRLALKMHTWKCANLSFTIYGQKVQRLQSFWEMNTLPWKTM